MAKSRLDCHPTLPRYLGHCTRFVEYEIAKRLPDRSNMSYCQEFIVATTESKHVKATVGANSVDRYLLSQGPTWTRTIEQEQRLHPSPAASHTPSNAATKSKGRRLSTPVSSLLLPRFLCRKGKYVEVSLAESPEEWGRQLSTP